MYFIRGCKMKVLYLAVRPTWSTNSPSLSLLLYMYILAVPRTTETRCRDRAYKHCTNNPIPTSFFCTWHLSLIMLWDYWEMTLCGFWHCHLYIPVHFWKMFYILVCVIFWYAIVHHIRECCSSALLSGSIKNICDKRQLLVGVARSWGPPLGEGAEPF